MSDLKANAKKTVRVGARDISIPDDWEVVNLKGLIETSGSGEWGEEVETDTNNKEASVLRSGDITLDGKLLTEDIATRYLSDEDYKQHAIEPFDIVIVSSSGSERHIGKKWLAPETIDQNKYHFTNFLYRIRLDESKCHPKFIYYFLCSDYETAFIQSISPTSTGLQNLDTGSYEDLTIPFPPLSEQHRIADILSTVDKQIQQTEDMVKISVQIKQGLMQELLQRGISHNTYQAMQLGPISIEIPSSWDITTLGDVTSLVHRYPNYYNIDYQSEGVPEVRVAMLNEEGQIEMDPQELRYISQETSDEYPKTVLETGDSVVVVRGRSLDKVGYVTDEVAGANMNPNLMRVSPNKTINSKFMNYLLLSEIGQKQLNLYSSGGNINTLKKSDVTRIHLPLPPLEEQSEIVDRIGCAERKVKHERTTLRDLQELKRGLMQDLLTGKVRVDPDA